MSSLFFRPVAGTCLVPMATCRYLFTVCSIVENGTVRVGGGEENWRIVVMSVKLGHYNLSVLRRLREDMTCKITCGLTSC